MGGALDDICSVAKKFRSLLRLNSEQRQVGYNLGWEQSVCVYG